MTSKSRNGAGFWATTSMRRGCWSKAAQVDYLTLEYLAELTLSILARLREKDPPAGYAGDFVDVLEVVCAGAQSAAQAEDRHQRRRHESASLRRGRREVLADAGLGRRTIGVVSGDDLLPRIADLQAAGCRFENLDTGQAAGRHRSHPVVSANAYLGAQPIADALAGGARIVITGRVADASLTVGPAMHEFGWDWDDWNRLAGGSVAGHLIECGAQATGGLYRHWENLDLANVGYPIAELDDDGSCIDHQASRHRRHGQSRRRSSNNWSTRSAIPPIISRPTSTSISRRFESTDVGPDRVAVRGATGRPAPENYKVSLAYAEASPPAGNCLFTGDDCVAKAQACGEMILDRVERAGFKLDRKLIELLGAASSPPSPLRLCTRSSPTPHLP